MSYGDSYEKFPINENEVWECNGSKIAVCDLTKNLPDFMLSADMVYCDPPWTLGNVNMFNSKAQREYMNDFSEFYGKLFKNIRNINPRVCFLEIGKQNRVLFMQRLLDIYPVVQYWGIKYYGKNECYLLRGGHSITFVEYGGTDDKYTPEIAINAEKPRIVADFCTGRGLTGLAALRFGAKFVGTELNKRKLAIFIKRSKSQGYEFKKLY